MPDRLVDKPCPPGQHRHGGGGGTFDYCHEVGRKHRAHAGEAVHELRGEHYSKPHAARNLLARFSVPEVEETLAWAGPRQVGNNIKALLAARSGLPDPVRHALGNAATEFLGRNEKGGMEWLRRAHERMGNPEQESKMQKAKLDKQFWCQECGRKIPPGRHTCPKCGSEDIDLAPVRKRLMSKSFYCQKCGRTVPMSTTFCPRCGGGDIAPDPIKKAAARPDATPVVAYEEKRVVINEVGTRLRAVAQKLDRMIKLSVANDLEYIEKRLERKHCC